METTLALSLFALPSSFSSCAFCPNLPFFYDLHISSFLSFITTFDLFNLHLRYHSIFRLSSFDSRLPPLIK